MNQFLDQPTTNFQRVRDGRNSMPLYIDIDLTLARSINAGTALKIDIAANSFYSDADTTNGGNAVVHFQDTNLGASSAPFFVSPGFIANVAFTQILIENAAQPGKRIRIFYGVDIDFQAGVNSSIVFNGTLNNFGIPSFNSNITYAGLNLLTANTPLNTWPAGSNANGIVITYSQILSNTGLASTTTLLAKQGAAPTGVFDGIVLAVFKGTNINQSIPVTNPTSIKVPANYGLYFFSDAGEVAGSYRHYIATLL